MAGVNTSGALRWGSLSLTPYVELGSSAGGGRGRGGGSVRVDNALSRVTFTSPLFTVNGAPYTPPVAAQTQQVSLVFSEGLAAPISVPAVLTLAGSTVNLQLSGSFSGTATGGAVGTPALGGGGILPAFLPYAPVSFVIFVRNNGTTISGALTISADFRVRIYPDLAASAGFGAGATAGLADSPSVTFAAAPPSAVFADAVEASAAAESAFLLAAGDFARLAAESLFDA